MELAILRRIALSLLTLLALAIFIFVATEVMPGDALDVTLSSDEIATIAPERLAQMKHELGLDQPGASSDWAASWYSAVQGDFGTHADQQGTGVRPSWPIRCATRWLWR
jgi:peptide/nickel transport system permease protein